MKLSSHPSLQTFLHDFKKAPIPSNRQETGNITGKSTLPYSYRKTNSIKSAIRLSAKSPRNFVTGSQREPDSIQNFLRVLPR